MQSKTVAFDVALSEKFVSFVLMVFSNSSGIISFLYVSSYLFLFVFQYFHFSFHLSNYPFVPTKLPPLIALFFFLGSRFNIT